MNNDIPTVNYPDITEINEALDLLNEDKMLISSRIVEAIGEAVTNGKASVDLFRVCIGGDSSFVMRCYRDEWKECLDRSKDWFESIEDYESCANIVEILSKL